MYSVRTLRLLHLNYNNELNQSRHNDTSLSTSMSPVIIAPLYLSGAVEPRCCVTGLSYLIHVVPS
jgi:hypothetical protein